MFFQLTNLDAQWFEKAEILKALNESSTILKLPPGYAIAHSLIRSWAESSAELSKVKL